MYASDYKIEVKGIRIGGACVKAIVDTKASSAQMAIIQVAGIDSRAIQWQPDTLRDAKGTYYDDVTITGYKWHVK